MPPERSRERERERDGSPSSRHRSHTRRHRDSSRERRDGRDRKDRERDDRKRHGLDRESDRHERKRRRTPEESDRRHRDRDYDKDDRRVSKDRDYSSRKPDNREALAKEEVLSPSLPTDNQRELDALRRGREARDRNFSNQERQQRVIRTEQDDVLYKDWLAKEDDFMVTQAKKRAVIRVREGRAKPIDHFVINLKLVDEGGRPPVLGDDEIEGEEFYITEPDEIIKDLPSKQMDELNEDIKEYLRMEKSRRNREFWEAVMVILNDFQTKSTSALESRAVSNVAD